MSNLSRSTVQGMIGMFYKSGIDIDDVDFDNHILTIAIPKDSYDFHDPRNKITHNPESFAKRIKQVFIEMGIFPSDCKVRYRVKDIVWTKKRWVNKILKLIEKKLQLLEWGVNW